MNRQILSEKEKDIIIYNYVVLKKGLIPSGKSVGVSQKTVEKVLKEKGIKKRTYAESKQLLRKYTVNDDYFKIQTPNMAYILGLLAADGNICVKENKITLELQAQDIDILEKIKEEVKTTYPIKNTDRNSREYRSLQIHSSVWKSDLKHYSIVPKKTKILEPPFFLQKKYYIDYIRGFFDGDGSIFESNGTLCCKFGGTNKQIIEWIRSYFANEHGIITNLYEYNKKDNICYYISYYGKRARQIYKLFYYNNDILKLNRKYNIFTELL